LRESRGAIHNWENDMSAEQGDIQNEAAQGDSVQKKPWFSNKEWVVLAAAVAIALAGTVAGAVAPRSVEPADNAGQEVAASELEVAAEETLPTSAVDTTTTSQPETTTTDTAASEAATKTSTAATTTAAKKTTTKKAKAKTAAKPKKTTPSAAVPPAPVSAIALLGLTLNYGTYQGAPLTWRVLEVTDKEILLLTDTILSSGAWRSDWENGAGTAYKNSDVRLWLNGEFLTASFSAAEANALMTRVLPGGLKDKVFLLNQQEATDYFATAALRTAAPGSWAVANAGYSGESLTVSKGKAAWWLVDTAKDSDYEVRIVRSDGKFDTSPVYYGDVGLRPAIVLDRSRVNLSLTTPAP
jgi:hypothetical protein